MRKINPRRQGAVPGLERKLPYFFLAGCILFFIALPARGYVLEGPHLLLLMTENLGTAAGLAVHQKLLIYDDAASDVPAEATETLTYRFSNAFRSESISPSMRRIHVKTLDAAVVIVDDGISAHGETRFDCYMDPLLFRSRILLQRRLSDNGINPMVSSLGRFEGLPVYVLGAHYPDLSTPQLWLEKETFRPIRLLFPGSDGQGGVPGLEFRYLQWQQNRRLWYPMRIQCYQNDRLIREMIAHEMTLNPLIPEDLFDTDRLRSQFGKADAVNGEMPSAQAPSDIQRVLDDFKKRYEEP